MNVQRLQVLASYLRSLDKVSVWDRIKAFFGAALPKKKAFDMNLWTCETAACALGTACQIPEFQAAGLGLELCNADDDDETDENGNRLFHGFPVFAGLSGFRAGSSFFGISYSAAMYLFDPDYYKGKVKPTDVALRIDYLLAHDGEPPDLDELFADEEDEFGFPC